MDRSARWVPVLALALVAVVELLLGSGAKASGAAIALGVVAVGSTVRRGSSRQTPLRLGPWMPALVPVALSLAIDLGPGPLGAIIDDPQRRQSVSAVAFAVALVVTVLLAAGVDVGAGVERAVRAVTGAVVTVVSWIVFVVVALPLGLARLWRPEDPMATGRGDRPGSSWHDVAPQPERLARRTYRRERDHEASSGPRGRTRALAATGVRVVGVAVLLVGVDYGLGAIWDHVDPDDVGAGAATVRGAIDASAGLDPTRLDGPGLEQLPPDPRADTEAMAAYPWREAYFDELRRAPVTYWPYLAWRPAPATGSYLNVRDGVRLSYLPAAAAEDPRGIPVVDVYGGGAAFGVGQRDDHTVASELARLAERAGLPIRAVNRGARGWVRWQELLLFEQVSIDDAIRPDVAIFYDGALEEEAQDATIAGVPSYVAADDLARLSVGEEGRESSGEPPPVGSDLRTQLEELGSDYRETSAVVRLGRQVRSAIATVPAGAEPAQTDADATAGGIYERGRELIAHLAEERGVAVVFARQPQRGGAPALDGEVARRSPLDLGDLLVDHDEVFIDEVHTNEEGAALVARALWDEIEPLVRAWYAENGD